jgi:hypothetical protein
MNAFRLIRFAADELREEYLNVGVAAFSAEHGLVIKALDDFSSLPLSADLRAAAEVETLVFCGRLQHLAPKSEAEFLAFERRSTGHVSLSAWRETVDGALPATVAVRAFHAYVERTTAARGERMKAPNVSKSFQELIAARRVFDGYSVPVLNETRTFPVAYPNGKLHCVEGLYLPEGRDGKDRALATSKLGELLAERRDEQTNLPFHLVVVAKAADAAALAYLEAAMRGAGRVVREEALLAYRAEVDASSTMGASRSLAFD